ncbi:transferase [Corynebacterium kutscheri]|uniref:Transferase n=1 Tax=Corynebacterium kutscheri TaxID=35755 RepID=A0A0F6R239_9CORY|nr:methyltransferase [Corynebacterium kutscheri]AKE41378.1 methyltransferase family protein [Corynebacterium kutscheri]VEH08655.1 transferase [Corynebacterium kutscheri]VEH09702.1 transferase [Corynebacterium kutscheri]VEH79784.1 transferase [Corynebacterium kutscheri]
MRSLLTPLAPRLVEVFKSVDFTPAGVSAALGSAAQAALYRGEPQAVLHALAHRKNDPIAILIQAFLLHRPVSQPDLAAVLSTELFDDLSTAKILIEDIVTSGFYASIDIRPHVFADTNRWVFSDMDASMIAGHIPGANHVLGVGAASLSLINTTPSSPVYDVLDLGTGSGVQLLGQAHCAQRFTATDVHPRALELAEATFAGADMEVELLAGSWFEPVAGRSFQRIISNPPFVVGPPEINHVYRDSGLDLDGATELVVSQVSDYLSVDGSAHILGAWVHRNNESWQQRVASWLPSHGVAAWILQRDLADPMHYVGTWLRDESIDPRSAEGQLKTEHWLRHFDQAEVTHIGFGYIAIQKIDESLPSEVLAEELTQPIDEPLGNEIEEYFLRTHWLRTITAEEILATQFLLRPGVAKEDVQLTNTAESMGFSPTALRLHRTDGPRFSHDIDTHLLAIIQGLHPQGLSLGEVADLYALSKGLNEDALKKAVVVPVVDLIRHGFILPSEITNL